MQDLMVLLVQCVGAGVALGLICLVLSYGFFLIARYLRIVFTP